MTSHVDTASTSARGRAARALGLILGLAAMALWAIAMVSEWDLIDDALRGANKRLLMLALLLSAGGMWCLALLWHHCLRIFGNRVSLRDSVSWYFAGEIGKYLPGGVWAVVGRAELARRGGIPRATSYATTALSLAVMCVGGALVMAAALPVALSSGGTLGTEWALLLLVPLGLVMSHPRVLGRILDLTRRLTQRRLQVTLPPWSTMIRLIVLATPPWLFVGLASVVLVKALGYDQSPPRVVSAAVAAWLVGFLLVPIPAGAGVREIVFLALCGLATGPAAAVAGLARANFLLVDGLGAGIALWRERRTGSVTRTQSPPGTSAERAASTVDPHREGKA